MSKYVGVIHQELFDLFLIDDGFNVPQKLAQIEKTAKKRFIEMSDEELHSTIQKLRKEEYHQDQKLTEEEFKNWVDVNKAELQIEKVYKEYLSVKNYLVNFKNNFKTLQGEVAKEVLEKETEEEINNYYFDKIGWVSALESDLVQLKIRLYHTFEAYKDLIEIPEEVKNEVDGLKFSLTYNVRGDELDLVDKEAYAFYKNQFLEGQKFLKQKVSG